MAAGEDQSEVVFGEVGAQCEERLEGADQGRLRDGDGECCFRGQSVCNGLGRVNGSLSLTVTSDILDEDLHRLLCV